MSSEKTMLLPEPKELPPEARTANVFSKLTEGSLTSIGQCCDHGCRAMFDEKHATIEYKGKPILQGNRNHHNKLWYFDLNSKQHLDKTINVITNQTPNVANYIIPKTNSEKLTRFLHGACGSPVVQTLIHGVKEDHLSTWPHLTARNIAKDIRAPTATILGHLDHQRKNKLSTKRLAQSSLEMKLDIKPEPIQNKCNQAYISLYEHTNSNRLHTDQTGKFPTKSIRGYQYILIAYVYDTNTILYRPLKRKLASELQSTYDELYSYLTARGYKPKFHRLDNEVSIETQELLEALGATVEIVPPNSHCRNAAERAIRTAKNHLIAILSATHENFPLYLWCYLLLQAEITLNLLRSSRIHPHLSAYHSLCGAFNFKRTPLAPPGIKVIAYNSVGTRESWATHGKLGCYVGPAMNHYRCYQVYIPSTRKIIISDTLQYTDDNMFEIPYKSKDDNLHDAVTELQTMMHSPSPLPTHTNTPRAQAIEKLRDLLLSSSDPGNITPPTSEGE